MSKKSRKSRGAYSKLNDADEIEMTELKFEPLDAVVSQPNNNNEVLPHDIYDNTSYIPNKHLRLMEIPMTSSLTFQKLLYYHGTYDIVHAILMIGGILHKMTVRKMEPWLPIVSLVIMGVWMIIEYFRLGFGYKGNINETFTEIVAFLAFSFFALILSAAPVIQILEPPFLPHEKTCLAINLVFVIVEFIMGFVVMNRFYKTQSAAFYLRTAPIIDKNFWKKYAGANDIGRPRELQLGMQKYDKERDFPIPFDAPSE